MFHQMQENIQEQTRKMFTGFQFPAQPAGQEAADKAGEKKK
jgi:hypothetical protein